MKVHHCMADGISAIRILARLCDEMDGDVFKRPVVAKKGTRRPHLKPVPENPPRSNPLNSLWRTATGITDTVARTVGGATEIASGLLRPTAGSSLVGPVTSMRRYRAVRVPLADVEQVCHKFDVTINDVALAAITEGFRSVLLRRGEQPRPDSLRTLVPVSVRSPDSADKPGNKISMMLPYLPVDEGDPLQQLRTVHSRMTRTKQGGQKQAGNMAVSVTGYVPFMLSSWLIRLLTRLPQRGIVTLATNVPGPHRRLEMMGHKVSRLLPIPPIALQLRTGVAVLSYADDLVFGITADYDAGADIDELADGIKIAVARLDLLTQDSILLFDKKSV
jgi:diacylglycerol O-acyltransferase / wax synthase